MSREDAMRDQMYAQMSFSRPSEEVDQIRQRFTQPTAYGGGVSEIVPANLLAVDSTRASGTVGDMSDPRKASFRWGDQEVENALKSMAETEMELA